jgi:hypothetical protein
MLVHSVEIIMMHGLANPKKIIVPHQEEFCTSSLQYFIMHLMRSLVADAIRMIRRNIIRIVLATRLLVLLIT